MEEEKCKETPFVDFGRKTQFSVKNAMGDTKSAVPILKERGQKWFPVSDYGECSGWVQQHFTCIKNGIIPVLGMETFVNNYRFSVSEDDATNVSVFKYGENEEWEKKPSEISDDELDWSQIDFPIDIFARTLDGYRNVICIHNDAQINGVEKRPRTTDSFLKTHGKGVVALMPTPYSEISSFIYNGDGQSALKKYEFYKSVFDDVLIEIPLLEDEDYREINANVIGFCQKNGIKMVPVINSHYDTIDDEDAFPIFQRCGALRGGMSYEVDHAPHMYMKTREEVLDTFHRFHESEVFTQEVMDGLLKSLDDLCESFTALELDTSPKTPHFENSDIELREHAWEGFHKCGFDDKPNAQVYKDRLEYELKNIIGAGFADYFILIERMFNWYKNEKHWLSSTGRGSASGSLVLRCLGVTKIDPVHHNLLFERFLDASRLDEIVNKGGKVSGADFPDVDNDVESVHKEEVKDYFANVYGKDNICSVGTVGYLHVKSTLKELGRVYGIDDKIINEITTKGLEGFEAEDDGLPLDELCNKFPKLKAFLDEHPQLAGVFKKLQGTINCWGVHAGGILISDKPLTDQLPVRVNKGKLASCWSEGLNGRELGEMGFLKLDLLAIETLDIIEDALELVNLSRFRVNLPKITFDEIMGIMIEKEPPEVLSRIDKGRNQGVFQFETPLALRVCSEMRGIRNFDDIASLSTLMRPAALQNKFPDKYGRRRDGEEEYFIPDCMKPFIEKEYGMPIFQEGAYFFGMYLAGMDKVLAYRWMKALYKNKIHGQKDIDYWHDKFVGGCLKKIKHEEYDIEFDNGETKHFTEFDKLKCSDGQEHTVKEIVEKNLEIDETQIV